MKNGQEIGKNSHYNTSRFYGNGSNLMWYSDLDIENVTRDDTANYSCFLRNEAGTNIDDALLVVLGKFLFHYLVQLLDPMLTDMRTNVGPLGEGIY